MGLVLLSALHDAHDEFEWVRRDTELGERYWTDVLAGTSDYRTLISSDASVEEVVAAVNRGVDEFRATRESHLLY